MVQSSNGSVLLRWVYNLKNIKVQITKNGRNDPVRKMFTVQRPALHTTFRSPQVKSYGTFDMTSWHKADQTKYKHLIYLHVDASSHIDTMPRVRPESSYHWMWKRSNDLQQHLRVSHRDLTLLPSSPLSFFQQERNWIEARSIRQYVSAHRISKRDLLWGYEVLRLMNPANESAWLFSVFTPQVSLLKDSFHTSNWLMMIIRKSLCDIIST